MRESQSGVVERVLEMHADLAWKSSLVIEMWHVEYMVITQICVDLCWMGSKRDHLRKIRMVVEKCEPSM